MSELSLNELLKKVKKLNKEAKYENVIELLSDEIIEKYKNSDLNQEKSISYSYQGRKYRLDKKYDLAIDALNKSIALNKKIANSYNELGIIYRSLKKYDVAIDYLHKAIEINPNVGAHYSNLGDVYTELNKYNSAMESYHKAIEINKLSHYAYNGLGNVFRRIKQFDKAIETYEKAIELNPLFASPYNGLGIAFMKKKEYHEAAEMFKHSIELDAKSEHPYNNLGLVFVELSDLDKALSYYDKALEINPNYAMAYYNRGVAFFKFNKYNDAIKDFEKYVELTKETSGYYNELAKEKIKEIRILIGKPIVSNIRASVNKLKMFLLYEKDYITHYTGLSVAKALILENSKFRISEGAFLNDTSEGSELFKYLDFTVSPIKENDTLANIFTKKPFIGSFVEENKHNDLALWRMYAKENMIEARGCSITLNRSLLIELITKELIPDNTNSQSNNSHNEFKFYRVVYKTNSKLKPFIIPEASEDDIVTLNEYINELANDVTAFKEAANTTPENEQEVLKILTDISYLFKSAEYQYEYELRFVLTGTGLPKTINKDFVPPKVYIESADITTAITKITLGPKVEKADEWAAAFYYSYDQTENKPEIHISYLPFK